MSDHEAKQATPHATLLAELLDPRIPKSEREHAAAREIERLTAERNALRRQLAEAERDSAMLDYVEQVFIDEGSGLELYPFGAVEDYADDRETVIGWKFLFGNAQGPTLRDAIYYAMGLTRPAEES